MKIKTSELTGAALDWAVMKATGTKRMLGTFKPSTNQEEGGEIIDQEGIATYPQGGRHSSGVWFACILSSALNAIQGPTRLIAAMRCFVRSKLGDEVEVPGELI